MKKLVVSICFIISMVMTGGFVAQNNDAKLEKSTDSTSLPKYSESNNLPEWTNSIEPFVGVWTLERTAVDADGAERKIQPGTFMVVHPNASYTIFVYNDGKTFITSQGNIIVNSYDVYIEVISQHVNNSLVGKSSRIDYMLNNNYLHKSFWLEKDRYGEDYKQQVEEIWKRVKMAVEGEYENSEALPI